MCFSNDNIFFCNTCKRVLVVPYLNRKIAIVTTYFLNVCSYSLTEFSIFRNYIQIATRFVAKKTCFVSVSFWSLHILMSGDKARESPEIYCCQVNPYKIRPSRFWGDFTLYLCLLWRNVFLNIFRITLFWAALCYLFSF